MQCRLSVAASDQLMWPFSRVLQRYQDMTMLSGVKKEINLTMIECWLLYGMQGAFRSGAPRRTPAAPASTAASSGASPSAPPMPTAALGAAGMPQPALSLTCAKKLVYTIIWDLLNLQNHQHSHSTGGVRDMGISRSCIHELLLSS